MSLAGVTAAILAGGKGTRLRSVLPDQPKVLAEVAGRPFLSYLLDQLVGAGVAQAVLCTGYLAWRVQKGFGHSYRGMRLSYSREIEPLGTGGALRLALDQIHSPTILAMNGDSFCQADLGAMLALHQGSGARVSLLATPVPDTSRYGRVCVDGAGRITSFNEKGADSGPGFINAGIYMLHHSALAEIPAGREVSLERQMLPGWLADGVSAWPTDGPFIDIGTPESLEQAQAFFPLGAAA